MDNSYAAMEAKAAAVDEYSWIKTADDQELSDELDRVMKINRDWYNCYLDNGRQTACIELMFEISSIELNNLRRDEERARVQAEAPLKAFEFTNWWYLHRDRHWPVTTEAAFTHVQKQDAEFLIEQQTTGFSTDDLQRDIADRQKGESENLACQATKKRREMQAEKDRQRKKDEGDKRFAGAVTAAAEVMLQRMLKDILTSGVLNGK